jgi:hypothetical protein
MKVIKRYDQLRRDLYIDIQCEACGSIRKKVNAYDDAYFWNNVIFNMKCKSCHLSTKDQGLKVQEIGTRYSEGSQV